MKPSIVIAFAITTFVAHMVTADISSNRVSDAWAEYYKQYYEEHNGATDAIPAHLQDRNTGYHAPSTSYDSPSTSFDSPSYVTSYSYPATSLDLFGKFGPETGGIVCAAALALGVLNLIGFVTLDNRIRDLEDDQDSICSAVRGFGGTNFVTVAAAADAATIATAFNVVMGQLNGVATPDCE